MNVYQQKRESNTGIKTKHQVSLQKRPKNLYRVKQERITDHSAEIILLISKNTESTQH